MTATIVLSEIDPRGVARVTLNRPKKHNAFDEQVIAALGQTLTTLGDDPAVRVVIVQSNGKNFSAGGDLGWMQRMANNSRAENIRDANALAALLHTLNFLPKPTIARVQGAALGGGAGLVCCCDIAVAADSASFAFSEARIGLIPATISPYVIRRMGAAAARRYFLTAERFDADRARQLGLVSEVVPVARLDERVTAIIDLLLQNGPQAVVAAKCLLADVEYRPVTAELMQFTSDRIADIRASVEGKEGLAAFLEKRKPGWIK